MGRTLFSWKRKSGWRLLADAILALGLLLSTTLAGCGRGIDPGLADRGEFEKFFQNYLVYAKAHGVPTEGDQALRIEFADLNSTEVGRCETGFLQGRIVYIDRVRWKDMSDGSKEALVLHELGHCLLNRGHRTDKFPADDPDMPGAQKSLMYPYATSGYRYESHKTYYLDELFANRGTRSAEASPKSHGPCAGCHADPNAALSTPL